MKISIYLSFNGLHILLQSRNTVCKGIHKKYIYRHLQHKRTFSFHEPFVTFLFAHMLAYRNRRSHRHSLTHTHAPTHIHFKKYRNNSTHMISCPACDSTISSFHLAHYRYSWTPFVADCPSDRGWPDETVCQFHMAAHAKSYCSIIALWKYKRIKLD